VTKLQIDPGSFRDRESRVFYYEGRVHRALSARALADWEVLETSKLFQSRSASGDIVATELSNIDRSELASLSTHWAGALVHATIPFISYPYEWSFSMLRDAAALQLELVLQALDEEMILKDSSAFNFQWQGAHPVLIDIGSFKRLEPGEPWVGYLQFCQNFLYPLMLTAYKDLPFHSWLRGAIDGVPAEDFAKMISARDMLRPGVLTHGYLQAKLQQGTANAKQSVRGALENAGFKKELIVANLKRMLRLVDKLAWSKDASVWAAYATDNSYDEADYARKMDFVRRAAATERWGMAWDLGCNTGDFSKIAAEHATNVIALDADHLAIERLFLELKDSGPDNILPLVNNLADSSPDLGWRGRERRSLTARAKPDLTLCLALIHHLVITANIPLDDFVDWLAGLGGHLVIEFVTKDDPMVKRLLLNKEDIYHDYEQENFEAVLESRYEIISRETLEMGTRTLYFARARDAA
jgi:hypothetical protein